MVIHKMKAIMCAFFPFKQYVDTTQHKTHEPHKPFLTFSLFLYPIVTTLELIIN